jgi:hypothetical protein
MTERYRPGSGDEGGQRPSGRGAVSERLAGQPQGAHEIDLTDEPARPDRGEEATAAPPAEDGDRVDRVSSGAFEPAAPTADPPADASRPGSVSIFDVGERARQEDERPTGYEPPVADTEAEPPGPRGETTVTQPGEPRPGPAAADTPAAGAPAAGPASLLGSLDTADVRNRFLDIQAGFVDEPRQAVEEAGRLVDDLLRQVADALQAQRGRLAGPTAEASTEDLRLALRSYRQFVDRLLGLAS